jgi:hypothetical protein
MQPIYKIAWSDEFIADVEQIADLDTFKRSFAGYEFALSRLPRGPGTWDLSDTGDVRMAHMSAHVLERRNARPRYLLHFPPDGWANSNANAPSSAAGKRSAVQLITWFAGPRSGPQSARRRIRRSETACFLNRIRGPSDRARA